MPLSGFIPPLSTPMRDGAIDVASFEAMLEHIAPHVDGHLVGGSVGEISSLTLEERLTLLRTVAAHRDDRHALCFSVADNSIENTIRLADAAAEAGADLLVVSAPNYFTVGYAELEDYLGRIAERAQVDLCLYDNPDATNMSLSVDDIAALRRAVPTVTHVKVTDTAIGKVAQLVERTDLQVFSGEDAVLWHQLAEGAVGAMVALPLICPERAAFIWRSLQAGDAEAAYDAYLPAAAFIHLVLGGRDYVAVIKQVLLSAGVIERGDVRAPLIALSDARAGQVAQALGTLNGHHLGDDLAGRHA